jgi:hypothetical protein
MSRGLVREPVAVQHLPPLSLVVLGQDPCLICRGKRPPLRPAAADLTILSRGRGLVSQSHRHCRTGVSLALHAQ